MSLAEATGIEAVYGSLLYKAVMRDLFFGLFLCSGWQGLRCAGVGAGVMFHVEHKDGR